MKHIKVIVMVAAVVLTGNYASASTTGGVLKGRLAEVTQARENTVLEAIRKGRQRFHHDDLGKVLMVLTDDDHELGDAVRQKIKTVKGASDWFSYTDAVNLVALVAHEQGKQLPSADKIALRYILKREIGLAEQKVQTIKEEIANYSAASPGRGDDMKEIEKKLLMAEAKLSDLEATVRELTNFLNTL